jgi:hypothetical protein
MPMVITKQHPPSAAVIGAPIRLIETFSSIGSPAFRRMKNWMLCASESR